MQTFKQVQREAARGPEQGAAWMPHPAALILLWIFLAVAVQSLSAKLLALLGVLLAAVVLKWSAGRLRVLLRRTRWIMLSLLLVYGYVTPGESLWTQIGLFSPTQQGLLDGLLQLSRLVSMLAALSVLLAVLPRERLVGGLYTLARPLAWVGLSRERLAVRLALTLHYAESSMTDARTDWRGSLECLLEPAAGGGGVIELHARPLGWRDGLLIGAGSLLLVAAVLL